MKFEVEVKAIEIYRFPEIEADSETEALEKAWDLLATEENRYKYHDNSDDECEVVEL